MKKLLICFCCVIAIAFACIAVTAGNGRYALRGSAGADSGFDADYGGGSSGGGGSSSWDDDDDYRRPSGGSSGGRGSSSWDDDNYRRSSGDGESNISVGATIAILTILGVVTAIGLFLAFYLPLRPYKTSSESDSEFDRAYKKFKQHESKNIDPLINQFYQNYVDIQIAWMNRDMTPVKHLLTNEMFNMYQMQLETLKASNQVNVMSDFEFLGGVIAEVVTRKEKSLEEIKIRMFVECKDFIINEKTNKIVSGDRDAVNWYYYAMTFVRNIDSQEQHCPSCGSLIDKSAVRGDKCKHCGNVLMNIKSTNYVLANKKMISQKIVRG